jgi:hypothetical protein
MEALKERMAKGATVISAERIPLFARHGYVLTSTPPSEGVIPFKTTVSPVELPVVVPVLIKHHEPCTSNPKSECVPEPAVHQYAVVKSD